MLATPTLTLDATELANRLRPVLLKLNRELRREIHSLGVTGGQVGLLVQIKTRPGIGMRELASIERMSVPGMSKFIGRLEEAGLVQRAAVAGDQRRVGLSLTPAGQKVLRSVKSRRTCVPADKKYGTSTTCVAPASTQRTPPASMSGSASSRYDATTMP